MSLHFSGYKVTKKLDKYNILCKSLEIAELVHGLLSLSRRYRSGPGITPYPQPLRSPVTLLSPQEFWDAPQYRKHSSTWRAGPSKFQRTSRTYFLPSTIFKSGLQGVRVEILGTGWRRTWSSRIDIQKERMWTIVRSSRDRSFFFRQELANWWKFNRRVSLAMYINYL